MCDHYAGTEHAKCDCVQPGKDKAKEYGIKIAWGESWNTVLGIRAQQYYAAELKNIKTAGDSSYTDNLGNEYDLENVDDYRGEGCEETECGVLYDLCDPANEWCDSVHLGDSGFFNTTTASKAKTLSEFLDYCIAHGKVSAVDLGAILGYHEVAPTGVRTTAAIGTKPPTFRWEAGNGDISSGYRNNRFRVVFFDSLGREILRSAATAATSYTLTASEWDTVLTAYGTAFRAGIYGYQTSYPSTGGYLSATALYNKPTVAPIEKSFSVPAGTRYEEQSITLQPGQYADYTLTFDAGGRKLFQTFGSGDACLLLYNNSGTLLTSDDNSGYKQNALISYSVAAGAAYTLRVKFSSSVLGGKVKVGVTTYTTAVTEYEKLSSKFKPNEMGGGPTTAGTVQLVRYGVTTAGSYSFYTTAYPGSAASDMYLYLIDPTSAEPCLYNDDGGGNLQAKINATLYSDREYLLIISMRDISQTGKYLIYFKAA